MHLYKTRREALYAMHNDENFSLSDARSRLRNDKHIVIRAVKIDMNEFMYASGRLKNNKAFVIDVLRINNWDMCYYSGARLEDYDDVGKFVYKLGYSCNVFISNNLQSDKDVAMAFICRCKHILSLASKELTNTNYGIVFLFIIFNVNLRKISMEMSNDEEIAVQCMELWYDLIKFTSFKLITNPKMIALALMKKPAEHECVAFKPDIKLSYYSISDNVIWMRLA